MSKRTLRRFRDYTVTDDGRVKIKDHVKISTSERPEIERDDDGRFLAVHIVPALGPDVGPTIRSAPLIAKVANNDLVYRGPAGRNDGRRAPRRLPQN